ncbi:DUF1302 domain-containing protein [Paraburkholderia sartisoli]|uniref:DUF1302 domain-containing protein n=1 Tax=Paraburkholderia sartisoli TaxID=83784 RepID=A0A1H4B1L9_9BURK|nr:DUF1302 family protein [Paraburkholderia sartisoli]SEA41989.1 Protein of unknown function [Paraburkholderia sartisoli]
MFDSSSKDRPTSRLPRLTLLASVIATVMPLHAYAFRFTTGSDWDVNWDNTVSYNVGMRAHSIDPMIGNSPVFDEGDYKFAHAGDIVTNRLTVLSEFTAAYQGYVGVRFSGSAWKDFAYGSGDVTNPAGSTIAPKAYAPSYPNGVYSPFTNRYYVEGAQLLDAFGFYNTDVAGHAIYFKVGQFTEYWGNSLLSPSQGISYAQGATDVIKALNSPGTTTKELLLPRPQVSMTAQVTPEVSVSGIYYLGWTYNRLPTGGTYLESADFIAQGPSIGPGGIRMGDAATPPNVDNNFGVKIGWTPHFMDGSMGFYFRRLDETQPWVLSNRQGQYFLGYNRGADLIGYSLDTTLGSVSAGFEASYRHNTALNTAVLAVSPQGATGNVMNIVTNAIVPLSRTPLWDTGTLTAEISYTHLLSVTQNGSIYNGIGSGYACGPNGDKWNGCSTRDYVGFGVLFAPQWLQVFPGVDISMPTSITGGLYGVNPINPGSAGGAQGVFNYSIGVQALIRQKATVTLAYNGYHAKPNGSTSIGSLQYYNAGSGVYDLNDRPWVSLTLQSSF